MASISSQGNIHCMPSAAMYAGNLHDVKELLSKDFDVNSIDLDSNETPLMTASSVGNDEIVYLLINYGASTNMNTAGGRTPLLLACMSGHVGAINILLQNGARPNLDCSRAHLSSLTPLYWAVTKQNIKTVETLVYHGAHVDSKYLRDKTILHSSVIHSNIDIVKLLIDRGADLSAMDYNGETPIASVLGANPASTAYD